MEQNIYSPASNLGCRYRFTCAAEKCQKVEVTSKPPCHIEKFGRYQPGNEVLWYEGLGTGKENKLAGGFQPSGILDLCTTYYYNYNFYIYVNDSYIPLFI